MGAVADTAFRPLYLADTSALTHYRFPVVRERLAPLVERGSIAPCGVVNIEILCTGRNMQELRRLRQERILTFPLVPTLQQDFERAMDVLVLLSAEQKHRAVKLADLLVAAVAERAGFTLLHYDADFDHIVGITGQPAEWVAPRGSLAS